MRGAILISSVIIIVIIALAGALLIRRFFFSGFPLPRGTTRTVDVMLSSLPDSSASPAPTQVLETGGVRHSIPLDEILGGGPAKDGIPSINDPKFLSVAEATYLNDEDPGIGIVLNGEARFYPYRVLVWHEIANDAIGGQSILVTYCPLCATGIVFERTVDGKAVEFGVSGKLWKSNLLMYDRQDDEKNESLWSQVLGEAVVGPQTGAKLRILHSEIVRWGAWKKAHSDTEALSKETGAFRDYSRDPYGDYYTSESVGFGASFRDTRLHPKALVYGVEVNGAYAAFAEEAVRREGKLTQTVGGKTVTAEWKKDTQAVSVSVPAVPLFWFSWLAAHPQTELYK